MNRKLGAFLGRSIGLTISVGLAVILVPLSTVTIDSGNAGVVTHFGAVQEGILPEGIHWIVPFRTGVVEMNVRIQKMEAEATASSKDLQNVRSKVALNYYLDKGKVNTIYQNLGLDYETNIIQPTIQESIKSATAQFTAEQLITARAEVKQTVFTDIQKRLAVNNIVVTDFSIVDFYFSDDFNKAIEAKQIAEQRALTAKNDLTRIQTEAKQAQAKAEGEAEAKLALARAEAEAQKLLAQSINDRVLRLRTIEKWNGVLPVSMGGGDNSFLDILGAVKKKK